MLVGVNWGQVLRDMAVGPLPFGVSLPPQERGNKDDSYTSQTWLHVCSPTCLCGALPPARLKVTKRWLLSPVAVRYAYSAKLEHNVADYGYMACLLFSLCWTNVSLEMAVLG